MGKQSSLLQGEDARIQAMRDGKDASTLERWMSKGSPTAPYAIFTLAPHYRVFLLSENTVKLNNGQYSVKVECHQEGDIKGSESTGNNPDIIKYKAWRDAILQFIPKDHLERIYEREQKGGE